MTKLEICPFCSNDKEYGIHTAMVHFVCCESCGGQGPTAETTEEAITLWNQRAVDAPTPKTLDLSAVHPDGCECCAEGS